MCSPRTESFEMSGNAACTSRGLFYFKPKSALQVWNHSPAFMLGAPYDIQAFEDNTQQEIWSGPDLLHTSHELSCLLLQKRLGW
jgi:hypothetical protein